MDSPRSSGLTVSSALSWDSRASATDFASARACVACSKHQTNMTAPGPNQLLGIIDYHPPRNLGLVVLGPTRRGDAVVVVRRVLSWARVALHECARCRWSGESAG